MGLSIVYFKGSQVDFSILWYFLSLEVVTCVALAKAGLVLGLQRPSVRLQHLFGVPSVV